MPKLKPPYKLKPIPKDATLVNTNKATKLYTPDEETLKNLKKIDPNYVPQTGNKLDYLQYLGGLPKIQSSENGGKSNYDFNTNTILMNNGNMKSPQEHYLAEIPHAYQNKEGYKIVGDLGTGYNTTGTTEHQAHSIIEPKLTKSYGSYDNEVKKVYVKLKKGNKSK